MSYIGAGQARALLGAWQEIVGWQGAGRYSNIHHGPYGGHRDRWQRRQFADGPAFAGGPSYGPYDGYFPGNAPAYPMPVYPTEFYPTQVYPEPEYPMQMYAPPPPPDDYPYPAQVYPVSVGAYPAQAYAAPSYATSGYGGGPALVDRQAPTRTDRITLPMSSGVNIFPNTSAQITSRPQAAAFRPERIIIGNRPNEWIINDVKVGNRSQFAQSGDVPGEMFAATTIDGYVSMETVQTAMDFVMVVTFIGDSQEGSPFVCGVLGTAAV
jgi:hypothetical protein